MNEIRIINTNSYNAENFAMCGYKNEKQEGYRRKVEWNKKRFAEGMKYKILYSDEHEAVGGIEYIPGEFTWRAVETQGYMMIHCIYIMKKPYKGKGYGEQLLAECLKDAEKENMNGAAVIARKGTWMAGSELFLKNGFEVVDTAPPDFELLVKRFNKNSLLPKFTGDWERREKKYSTGLTLVTSDQCPYTSKAINEISETAKSEYGITPKLVELKTAQEAQQSPCAFGCFCILFDGKVVADHPVSRTRFRNIMNNLVNLT
jgi:L-amino acid N-acyltransferase YncA